MDFMENEKQFHLGFLPTEQSNPMTADLDKEFAKSFSDGVRNLQSVDRNVQEMAKRIFKSDEFEKLVADGEKTVRNGGRIVFSGCGATGRLSILLECMWRDCCAKNKNAEIYSNNVFSIMTGGDYALVKSVEFFEDYQVFGKRQVQELDLNSNDMLVAITEGGETSSVLGSVFEALDRKCKVFLMFNNPADLLADNLERSCRAIRNPDVTVLDLFCGPMALAGSTRMQATTSEQLIAGGALESIFNRLTGLESPDYAAEFEKLLDGLASPESVDAMAEYIGFEAEIYKQKGLITYFANDYLLDIFTDTTERSPTFMLPPFRKNDDKISPRPWAFVKNPLFNTVDTWRNGMHRNLRCLEWETPDYEAMGIEPTLSNNPPKIKASELLKFEVGNESPSDRISNHSDAAVLITVGNDFCDEKLKNAFNDVSKIFNTAKYLSVGGSAVADFSIPCKIPSSPLNIMGHMAVKLVLNTISTGTMAVLGRITGNWMSWVNVSNKKLMDRGVRLISEIGHVDYKTACIMLYESIEELENSYDESKEQISVVQHVLKKLGR